MLNSLPCNWVEKKANVWLIGCVSALSCAHVAHVINATYTPHLYNLYISWGVLIKNKYVHTEPTAFIMLFSEETHEALTGL